MMFIRAAIFIVVMLSFAGIAWIGGFNFDIRNGWVAYMTVCAIVLSAWVASIPIERKETP